MIGGCPFCIVETSPNTVGGGIVSAHVETRILQTVGSVYIFAGLGAIVEPYVLISTFRHCLSLTELTPGELVDVSRAFNILLESKLFPSGKLTFFEHGGKSTTDSVSCIDHFHIHVIDGSIDLRRMFVLDYPEVVLVRASEFLDARHSSGYLLAGVFEGGEDIAALRIEKPSCGNQYFRRLLGNRVGSPNWNWRLDYNMSAVQRLRIAWNAAGVMSGRGQT